LIDAYNDGVHKLSEELIAIQEKIDMQSWNMVKKQEDVDALVSSIDTLNERYTIEKDVNKY
jgi:hypothetical protein